MEDRVSDDVLSTLVQYFEAAEEATTDSRALAERDRDYRNGVQWTPEETAALNERKQPVITIDRIGPKVDFLVGMEAGQRSDPKAYPRTPKEEEGANAASDSIRYVLDQQRWDRVRSECFEFLTVEGLCGVDVGVTEGDDPEIMVKPIMWDRMFYDPHSRKRDFSDARYRGQFIWTDLDDAVQMYPDKEAILEATMTSESGQGETYDDVPRTRWSDPKRKRVRIVEIWTREAGKVFYTCYTKAGILKRQESPYVNAKGEPVEGFILGSNYIDRDGNRFGVVRRWISLQDEINKRRSKAMHLMSVRQTYGNQTIGDKNNLRKELARPDGHVEMQGGAKFGEDFGVIPTTDMATAQFQLLQEAKQEIDAVGVNAALSGTEGRNMSGRALMARQEQGLNELGPTFDNFKQWQLDVYRAIWDRIRQFWTAEKWVRVTDDERNTKFVGLNAPITLGEQLIEEAKKQGQKVTPDMEQRAKMLPALQQIVGTRNNVAQMDVDITLDTVPATASLQIEQFEALANLASKGVPIPPEALIEASTLRNKDAILKKMGGGDEEIPPQAQQALQAAAQEIEALRQQLQEAQSGMAAKQLEVQGKLQQTAMVEESKAQLAQMQTASAERIAAINADVKRDVSELAGAIQLMAKKLEVPLSLGQEVEADLAEPEAKPDPMMMLAEAIGQMNQPKRKRMAIQAPSGEVYQGMVEDEHG